MSAPCCLCSTCGAHAVFEDFLGWFVHDFEPDDQHNVTRLVAFDGGGVQWTACDTGRTWNGWAIPAVTPAVRDEIAAWCDSHDSLPVAQQLRALEEEDGLVVLDLGLTFSWVSP